MQQSIVSDECTRAAMIIELLIASEINQQLFKQFGKQGAAFLYIF